MRDRIYAEVFKTYYLLSLDFQAHQLDAPADPEDGTPRKWLPCECCHYLDAVPRNVVSFVCSDCQRPCHHTDCGLLLYQHVDDHGNQMPCEPVMTSEDVEWEPNTY